MGLKIEKYLNLKYLKKKRRVSEKMFSKCKILFKRFYDFKYLHYMLQKIQDKIKI